MNSKNAIQAWEADAAQFTDFITVNRRQPYSHVDAERRLYVWGLRHVTRLHRGMLNEHQEQVMNGILDLYDEVARRYPTKTPSLDGAEQFHAAHGRLPSPEAAGEEGAAAKALSGYIRACRYRDGFRPDALERLLALPGAIPENERAAFQRALHMLRTYRRPLAAPADTITFKGVPLNPAARPKRVPAVTAVRENQEYRYNDKWNAVFTDFSAWVKEHGALPRRRSTDPQEKRLANWLNVQRRNHRGNDIPENLEAILRTVPGALEPAQFKSPEQWYESINAFLEANHRLPTAKAAPGTEERSMAEYISGRLRPALRAGKITPDDSEALARLTAAMPPVRVKPAA